MKSKYGYIVDSSLGMDEKELLNKNIFRVNFDISDSLGNHYEDNNKELTPDIILEKLSSGIMFKSNAVTPGKVMLVMEEIADKYEKIILFTISSGLSSFYENVQFLKEEYKDKLFIVDTKEIGIGIQDIVLDTKRMLEEENKELDDVLEIVSNYYKKNYTIFTCKSWEPLRKGGRAPSVLAKAFDFFKTKPLIRFEVKNKLGGVATSFKKQISKMIESFFSTFKKIELSSIKKVVFYNNKMNENDAQYVRNEILKRFNLKKDELIETMVPNLVLIYTANESFGLHIQLKK